MNDHHVETTCHAQHLGATLKVKVTVGPFSQNSFRPITLWFEVEFYNYFTGMITILKQLVMCYLEGHGHSMTLQQNRVWPKLCYLKLYFMTTFDKLLLCVQYLFGEHTPVLRGSCFPFNLTYVFLGTAFLILLIISQCLMLNLLRIPLCQHYLFRILFVLSTVGLWWS